MDGGGGSGITGVDGRGGWEKCPVCRGISTCGWLCGDSDRRDSEGFRDDRRGRDTVTGEGEE